MRMLAKPLLAALAASLVAFAIAGPAGAASLSGTVVGKDGQRHSLLVAGRGGVVHTVRVSGAYKLKLGVRVAVTAVRLADDTFRAAKVRALGRVDRALVVGTVFRTEGRLHRYLLSTGEGVLAVRHGHARAPAHAGKGPRAGDRVGGARDRQLRPDDL